MMRESEDELTSREAETLRKLAKEKPPPAAVESRIIDALREAQLIRNSWFNLRRPQILTGSAFALSLVIFTMGIMFGAWWSSTSVPPKNVPQFMLVLRNSPRQLPSQSAQDRFQRVKEYSAWSRDMSSKGVVIDGEKLKDEKRLLNVVDGRAVVSNFEESANAAIAGYFLIYARDYQEAVVIAENCPHLKYGGTIEIRQIDSVAQPAN